MSSMNNSKSEKPQTNNAVKKFTHFISRSSKHFLSSFLDDESQKEKETQHILQLINQAIAQKSMVVIQYRDVFQTSSNDEFETLVGRVYQHQANPDSLMIKLQKTNQVRMISAKYIKKLSIINPGFHRQAQISK